MALTLALASTSVADPESGEPPRNERFRTEEGLFKVLSPKNGGFVRGGDVRLKLAPNPGVSLRYASLNGIHVKRYFQARGSGSVVAALRKRKLGNVLERGQNFLRFIVRKGGAGGPKDYETVGFTRVKRSDSLIRDFDVDGGRGGPARVTLATSKLHARIRVVVNGRNVSRALKRDVLNHTVEFGANEGLKHGTNRIEVRVLHNDGEIRTLRGEFQVSRRATIAGAGPDRSAPTGTPIRLNGTASKKARTRAGTKRPGKLRYRWKIVDQPPGSKPRLVGRAKPKPQIQTDMPGDYKLKLRTTQGPRPPNRGAKSASPLRKGTGPLVSADLVTATSDAQPYVAYNAFATLTGESGISVEASRGCVGDSTSCFFDNPGADGDLQVVTLARDSLQPVEITDTSTTPNTTYGSNLSYSTSDGGLADFAKQIEATVTNPTASCPTFTDEATDPGYLVLLSLRSGKIEDTDNWNEAMKWFNLQAPADQGTDPTTCAPPQTPSVPAGPFAQVGVPGMFEGRAWINDGHTLDSDPTAQAGNLYGFLSATANDPVAPPELYAFRYPDVFSFDTRDGNFIKVAGSSDTIVPSTDPSDIDALMIYQFDPVNPQGTLTRAGEISNSSGADTGLAWNKMQSELANLIEADVGVAIVATGDIGKFESEPESDQFLNVLDRIQTLGGNSDTFARAVNENGTYSLISVDGVAYQSSSVYADAVPSGSGVNPADLPVNDGRLTGILLRGPDGRVYPRIGDPSALAQEADFLEILQQSQTDWLLTPEIGAKPTCQETAFAYIVADELPGLVQGGPASLWSGADASNCQNVDHTGTTGPNNSADNLDNDGCAVTDPAAAGAQSAAVRNASLALRGEYQTIGWPPPDIDDVKLPSNAPFVEADLQCAINQMDDEFNALRATQNTMNTLQKPTEDTQGNVVIDLGTVANNVQTEALAPISKKIKENGSNSTSSFWAGMGFSIFENVADIAVAAGGDEAPLAFTIMALIGESGSNFSASIEGAGGNPVAATDDYLLMQAQLTTDELQVEDQIENSLTAQQNGVAQAASILYADPAKLEDTSVNSENVWAIDSTALESAQDNLAYRVTQMAYQAMWPQVYSAVRVNWNNACQFDQTRLNQDPPASACYNDGGWNDAGGGNPDNLIPGISTSDLSTCHPYSGGVGGTGAHPISSSAYTGNPVGLGQGSEYHPYIGVGTTSTAAPYQVLAMVESDELGKNYLKTNRPSSPDSSQMSYFFDQPTGPDDNQAAGLYGPDFWLENISMSLRLNCRDNKNEWLETSPVSGLHEDFADPTDIWPTAVPNP